MSKDSKPNSLDQMRAHINLFENFQIQQNIALDEAFPILKQQLAGKMLGLAGKVSRKAQSQALIRQALTAYLKTFVSYMGRINKNWDTEWLNRSYTNRGQRTKTGVERRSSPPLLEIGTSANDGRH